MLQINEFERIVTECAWKSHEKLMTNLIAVLQRKFFSGVKMICFEVFVDSDDFSIQMFSLDNEVYFCFHDHSKAYDLKQQKWVQIR